jgi:hypothetical protein
MIDPLDFLKFIDLPCLIEYPQDVKIKLLDNASRAFLYAIINIQAIRMNFTDKDKIRCIESEIEIYKITPKSYRVIKQEIKNEKDS